MVVGPDGWSQTKETGFSQNRDPNMDPWFVEKAPRPSMELESTGGDDPWRLRCSFSGDFAALGV